MRFLIILSLLLSIHWSVQAQKFKGEKGEIVFISQAPLSEFEGKSNELNGLVDLENNLLDFFIDLNTLKTGIGLRDRHMRENYLETKKFPFAEFTGKLKTVPKLTNGTPVNVVASGQFKIHGVEKNIEVPGQLTLEGNELLLKASFKVLLSDYKISIPKVMFYELAEEQIVNLSIRLKK
ncbi:YceI family protein [Mongoliitalea daihaiensis]|uniref:YceI family protein n=1 Tax=Mongoliitalea daihaiensis TaxID=2782006 RepID=UPI001F2A7042|nr:YceI family protein [Mongoliitalea daihaiensis]UJP64275.1 YceI family protein [Mongoliitalea daihaiensis]